MSEYIVVGGGLTGCVIASRLSEAGSKVVLIEAGPDPSDNPAVAGFLSGLSLLGGELDNSYQSEPEPNTAGRVHTLNTAKALGGGSILNFGGWLRADARDYDDWAAAVGDPRWSHQGFKPWFRKVERSLDTTADPATHGFDGPMTVSTVMSYEGRRYPLREPVRKAWDELGATAVTDMLENSKDGQRQPSYSAYPLAKVDVLTSTAVRRVLFDGTKATGVELADGRKLEASKEVILCAGSYRTPQVLMLSGVGPSAKLAELGIPLVVDAPDVGQNLHDHFAVYFAFKLRDPSGGYALGSPAWTDPGMFKGLPWDWILSEPLPDMSEEERRNLYEILVMYVAPGIPGVPVDGSHIATSTMLLRPTSRGSLTLRSADLADAPRIEPNYFSTPLDRQALVFAARRTLQAVLATESMKSLIEAETPPQGEGDALAPLTPDSSDAAIEDRIRKTGMQHHHSGGTAAMGKVVDTVGRVTGVSGLRIADASIVPMPIGGHPQATLYPMAEQLASIIIAGGDS